MTRTDIENQLRQMAWETASPALRSRVLALAPATPASVPWSDRVWFSRAFRWSAAAAVVLLVAILSRPASFDGAASAGGSARADAEAVRTVARDAGLSDDVAASLARRAGPAHEIAMRTTRALQQLAEMDGGH